MPRQSEIDRMLVLFYLSNNAHGFINYVRPAGWLDSLPMAGLEELDHSLETMRADVSAEIEQRKADGIPKYSRRWHDQQEQERHAGSKLLRQIGVKMGSQTND